MAQMFRLLKSGLVTSGPAQFHGRSPKGTLTFRQLEGQKTVLSSFEKFHPRDHCAAPGKSRPSRSIPGCAGHRARGRGTAACAPQDRPHRATHPGPAFSNKMSPESRGRGATGRRLRPRPQSWGQRVGRHRVPALRREARGRVPLHPDPTLSTVPVPARRLCPPPPTSAPQAPGTARSRGAGIPASEPLGSPLSSRPSPSAYLCCGPPAAAPEVLAAPGAGLPGLSAGARPAPSPERAGRGQGTAFS